MSFDMSEVDRLADDLAAAPLKVSAKSSLAVERTAHAIARDASIMAPKLTGYLSENIEVSGFGMHATITAKARYAGYVEEGTSDTAPQPFMRPAAERNGPKLVDDLGDAAENIL